jgi:hypothetical protein
MPPPRRRLVIQWTANGQARFIEYVGVDHGRRHIFVAEEFMYRANIIAILQEVCSETAPREKLRSRGRRVWIPFEIICKLSFEKSPVSLVNASARDQAILGRKRLRPVVGGCTAEHCKYRFRLQARARMCGASSAQKSVITRDCEPARRGDRFPKPRTTILFYDQPFHLTWCGDRHGSGSFPLPVLAMKCAGFHRDVRR